MSLISYSGSLVAIRINGENRVRTRLIFHGECEGRVSIVLRSVLVEHHGVPAQPGRGGGDGPGQVPGDTRQQSLSEHPDLKHQLVKCGVCGVHGTKRTNSNKYKIINF